MGNQKVKELAIKKFVERFKGSYKKIGINDVDYRVFDSANNLIAYAEVILLDETINTAYPLEVKANNVVRVCNKRLNPVIIWSCADGLIYGKPNEIIGQVSWKDNELVLTYPKQKSLRYIKYY